MSGFTITREDQQGSQVYVIRNRDGQPVAELDSYATALGYITRLAQQDQDA